MAFTVKCRCGAVIPPEKLVGLRLDKIQTECDACKAMKKRAAKRGEDAGSQR